MAPLLQPVSRANATGASSAEDVPRQHLGRDYVLDFGQDELILYHFQLMATVSDVPQA